MEKQKRKYIKKEKKSVSTDVSTSQDIKETIVPENLPPKKETAEETANRLLKNEEPIKGKRKYTKRNSLDENESDNELKPLVELLLKFTASRLPSKIEPSSIEIDTINLGVSKCLQKYGGDISEYMPLITLAGGVAMFTLPRLRKEDETEKISDEIKNILGKLSQADKEILVNKLNGVE